MRLTDELSIHPTASTNLACARFSLAPGSHLSIGPGVSTERLRHELHFVLAPGARVEVGEGAWLRTEVGPVRIVADRGSHLSIGPEAFLNGCHVSAKRSVRIGRRANVGMGARVFDADQHDLDAERPEGQAAVEIGDHCWVAADVTVLKGVRIGPHSVVGARSVVTGDIPEHVLAVGAPARVVGSVGDRTRAR